MKPLIRKIVQIKYVWWFIQLTLGTLNRVFKKLVNAKNYNPKAEQQCIIFETKINKIFSQLTVCNGPFKGMRYPSIQAVGSTIYPKLLGSYEKEIAPAISYIIQQPYSSIVDIGCAEGYYAIGIAMHMKKAKVFAFDTNQNALSLCNQMATLNDVKIETGGFCDKDKLQKLELGDKALIFCDCEGYEIDLIDEKLATSLKQHDFLIETHDFIQIDITQRLLEILNHTHNCEIFESIDDILKAYQYQFPELDSLDLEIKHQILAEQRPQTMRWIFAKSKE